MHNELRIALLEDNIIWGDKEANLQQLAANLDAIKQKVDVVLLPEMFSTGFMTDDKERALSLAERNTERTIEFIKQLATKHNLAICGSFLARTANQIYNRAFFIEPSGDETFYDKRHLFQMGGEPKVFTQGKMSHSPIVRFRGFNLKIAVCYDLRFPVFCRARNNDYDALLFVANWPVARQSAWKSLLCARAIENLSYVCGVNRSGSDEAGIDYGTSSSYIFDFKGKQMETELAGKAKIATLVKDKLNAFRTKFPAWQDADPFTLL